MKKRDRTNVSSMIASVDSNTMKLNMDIILEKGKGQEAALGLHSSPKENRYSTATHLEEAGNRFTILSTEPEGDDLEKIETA